MHDTQGFAGLRVAAFESRRAAEMTSLIERFGGVASVSPSMREVPISENREAVDFAHRVMTGQIDIIIFMTGVGIRHLLAEVERHVDRERLLAAISDIVTIARGPKPVAVLRELGLKPTHRVPEPNTWREVLATIDREKIQVSQQNVGLQEYGLPNASLVAGLEARGAHVSTVKVYKWELPLDVAPLEANVRALAAGELDVMMFTSSHQVVNLLRTAEKLNLTAQVREAIAGTVIASIGPTTSETLVELGQRGQGIDLLGGFHAVAGLAQSRQRGLLGNVADGFPAPVDADRHQLLEPILDLLGIAGAEHVGQVLEREAGIVDAAEKVGSRRVV